MNHRSEEKFLSQISIPLALREYTIEGAPWISKFHRWTPHFERSLRAIDICRLTETAENVLKDTLQYFSLEESWELSMKLEQEISALDGFYTRLLISRNLSLWQMALDDVSICRFRRDYTSNTSHIFQKLVEAELVEELVNRLHLVSSLVHRIRKSMRHYSPETTREKQRMATNCLYWHFLELQILRWDLRSVWTSTAKSWKLLFQDAKLGWQMCWRGDRRILQEVEDYVNDCLRGESDSEAISNDLEMGGEDSYSGED